MFLSCQVLIDHNNNTNILVLTGKFSNPLAASDQHQPLVNIWMNIDLSVQGPHDPQAFWVLLGGQVPGGPDLELSRPLAAPEAVLALLQRLQDEEVIGGDQLHYLFKNDRSDRRQKRTTNALKLIDEKGLGSKADRFSSQMLS